MANQHQNSEYVVQSAVNHLLAQDAEYNRLKGQFIDNQSGGAIDHQSYLDANQNKLSQSELNKVGHILDGNQNESYKKINKFAKAMHKKYSKRDMSLAEVVEHSRRHAAKIGLGDSDLRMFEVLYQNIADKASNNFPNSNRNSAVGKALGTINPPFVSKNNLKVASGDRQYVDEIMRISALNKQEHARCVLQADAYTIHGMHEVLTQSVFQPGIHNKSCAVHPLVVALFGPKITILDQRMLHSNLARIIVDRLQGLPIRNRADFEFFIDLTTDQQESVCDSKSIFSDILKRIEVQEMLRRTVWQMRGGQMYECNTSGLIAALDNCALNPADSPHLLYVRDEGTMLRRLLHCFSFKPTHVTTRPIFAMTGMVPPIGRLDQLTMVNVQIPHHSLDGNNDDISIPLAVGLQTPHWYLENGIVIPKQNSIVYSREVIFFYVNRRYQSVGSMYNSAFQFSKIPVAISGFHKINTVSIDLKQAMKIHQHVYILRSVVCATIDENNSKMYNGCCTYLLNPIDTDASVIPDKFAGPGWGDDSAKDDLHELEKDATKNDVDLQTKGYVYKYDPYASLQKTPSNYAFTDGKDFGKIRNLEISKSAKQGLIPVGYKVNGSGMGTADTDVTHATIMQKHGIIYVYSQPMEDKRGDLFHSMNGMSYAPQTWPNK